jgi:hypothetical protein
MPTVKVRLYEDERYPDFDLQLAKADDPLGWGYVIEVSEDWYHQARRITDAYDALMAQCTALLDDELAQRR